MEFELYARFRLSRRLVAEDGSEAGCCGCVASLVAAADDAGAGVALSVSNNHQQRTSLKRSVHVTHLIPSDLISNGIYWPFTATLVFLGACCGVIYRCFSTMHSENGG